MYRTSLWHCGWLAVIAILLIVLIPGCGDDNPTKTTPVPNLTMSLVCESGLFNLTVQNSGGSMGQPSRFVATFADGHSDTLMMSVPGNSSTSCPVSNVHGNVTVTNGEWDLQASTDACLSNHLQGILASVNLANMVPSPFAQQQVLLCTYTTYLQHLTSNPPTVELIKRDSGLILTCTFSNITGDLKATSPGFLCPDLTGNVSISSIVVSSNIDIVEGDTPTVTLGNTQTTVSGFQVQLDGAFGFIFQTVLSWFQGSFVTAIQNAISNAITQSAPDLAALMVPNSGCD